MKSGERFRSFACHVAEEDDRVTPLDRARVRTFVARVNAIQPKTLKLHSWVAELKQEWSRVEP